MKSVVAFPVVAMRWRSREALQALADQVVIGGSWGFATLLTARYSDSVGGLLPEVALVQCICVRLWPVGLRP